MRDARCAGGQPASKPVVSRIAAAMKMVEGSVAVSPKSIEAIQCDAVIAARMPVSSPSASGRRAFWSMSQIRLARLAPRAIRMPSSLVRRATV